MLTNNHIYKKNILYTISNKIVVKILIFLEMLPLILVLDDIIFERSYDYIQPLLYILSNTTWFKFLQYTLLTPQTDLNNKVCHLAKINPTASDYMTSFEGTDYTGTVYSTNYFISAFLALYLLLCVISQNTARFTSIYKDYIFVQLANLLMRYLSLFYLFFANDQLFTAIYLYYSTHAVNEIVTIVINAILQLFFILYINFFIDNSTCIFRLYPYDPESLLFEKMLLVLKVLSSTLYGFNKLCNINERLFLFLNIVYCCAVILLFSLMVKGYRRIYLANCDYNSFRMLMCLALFNYFILKVIYMLFGITETFECTCLLIAYIVITVLIHGRLNKKIHKQIFFDSKYFTIELYFYSMKYLALLEQTGVMKQKNIYNCYFEFAKRLAAHKHKNKCSDIQNCIVCNKININKLSADTDHNTFLDDYFTFHSGAKLIRDDMYYDILRINCYMIKMNKNINNKAGGTNTTLSYTLVFDLFRLNHETGKGTILSTIWKFYIEVLFIDFQKTMNKQKNHLNQKEHSIVENFYFTFEFEGVLKQMNELITIMLDNFDINLILDKAEKVYACKKSLQKYYSNAIMDKDSFINFSINFNYKYLFNRNISKSILFDDNLELINFYEENFEKTKYFILEYLQIERNLIIRTVSESLLKDTYYELEELKNKKFSFLFPGFALVNQINETTKNLESMAKEQFQLKLIIKDKKGFIRYFLFNFKILIGINMRVFLITNFAAQKIDEKSKNNLFVINSKGELIYYSENFFNYIMYQREQNNFFDLINLSKEQILTLPRNDLKNQKHIDIKSHDLFKEGIGNYEPNTSLRINFINKVNISEKQCYLFEIKRLFLTISKNQFRGTNISLPNDNLSDHLSDEAEESTFRYSASVHYTSTVMSDSTKKSLNDDHLLPGIVRNNLELFRGIYEKTFLFRLEYLIYTLNAIIILVGIVYLIYFERILSDFKLNYQSLYSMKTLQMNIYRQMVSYSVNLKKYGQTVSYNKLHMDSFEIKNRMEIQQIRNQLISSGLKSLKKYLDVINKSDEFYKLMDIDSIEYLDIDNQVNGFVVKNNTMVNILDILYIHLNSLADLSSYTTDLNLSELDVKNDKYLQPLLFITYNFFPVFSKYFKDLDVFINTTITDNYNFIVNSVFNYYIIFLATHCLILIMVIYYLILMYNRFLVAFKFKLSFDKTHLKNLGKKYINIAKSVNYLITPSTLITNLKQSLNLVNLKKKDGDRYTNIKEERNKGDADMLIPLSAKLRYVVRIFMLSGYMGPIALISTIYIVYFAISLVSFNMSFRDVFIFSKYIGYFYGFQTGAYECFLITRLSYISDMDLSSPLDSDHKSKEDFKRYFEAAHIAFIQDYRNMLTYTYNYGIFSDLNQNILKLKGPEQCETIIFKEDPLLSQFANISVNDVRNALISQCQGELKEGEDVVSTILEMTQSLRMILYRLESNDNADEIDIKGTLFLYPIEIVTSIRYYFSYVNTEFNDVILNSRLIISYNICIVLFVICVSLDIGTLVINKIFILLKIMKSDKIILNLLNMLKR
jgi:hypothetical protein